MYVDKYQYVVVRACKVKAINPAISKPKFCTHSLICKVEN